MTATESASPTHGSCCRPEPPAPLPGPLIAYMPPLGISSVTVSPGFETFVSTVPFARTIV